MRGQLACLVDGTRRVAGLRVAAGERGQRDEDGVAAVAGGRSGGVGDEDVGPGGRVADDDGRADRPRRQGPVERAPVRGQVEADRRAGARRGVVLEEVRGLGHPVGEDARAQLDALTLGGPGQVVVPREARPPRVGRHHPHEHVAGRNRRHAVRRHAPQRKGGAAVHGMRRHASNPSTRVDTRRHAPTREGGTTARPTAYAGN